jgi:hypothetical protein
MAVRIGGAQDGVEHSALSIEGAMEALISPQQRPPEAMRQRREQRVLWKH